MRNKIAREITTAVLAGICTLNVAAAELDTKTAMTKIENLSASEKDELRRKQDRFRNLAPEEQERIRNMEATLQSDPDGARLRQVMLRYHVWLRALPSSQRTEILSAPLEQRIVKIKGVLAQQEDQRRKEFAMQSVQFSDWDIIRKWVRELFKREEPKLVPELTDDFKQQIEKMGEHRMGPILAATIRKREIENDEWRFEKALSITEEDRQELISKLSTTAQAAYENAPSDVDRRRLVHSWVRMTIMREVWDGWRGSPFELRRYSERADPKLRDQIRDHYDYLPRDQRRAELDRAFRFDPRRWSGGEGTNFGPGYKGRSGSFKKGDGAKGESDSPTKALSEEEKE